MKNSVILFVMIVLTGCASVQHVQGTTGEVVNSVPAAIGTVAAAAVFGGEVSMVPDPAGYIKDDINREGRIVYGDARRKTKQGIANMILILFETTK